MDRAASIVVSNGIPRPIRRDAVMTLWPRVLARTADPEVSQTLAAHGASTIETVRMKSKIRGNNCQSMTKRAHSDGAAACLASVQVLAAHRNDPRRQHQRLRGLHPPRSAQQLSALISAENQFNSGTPARGMPHFKS